MRQERPATTSLLRELHAAVTDAQIHYTARDQFGRRFRRLLAHGAYKDEDNHVRLPDGTLHEHASAAQTPAEMERLVAMIENARGDHPVRVAAFAHHRFTQIHPFQDGNGRTARLLASLLLVRSGFLSFVVDREERDAYLRALREADENGLLTFIDFVVARQRDVLLRVEQAVFTPSAATSLQGLSQALATYAARRRMERQQVGDPEREVVRPLGALLEKVMRQALSEALQPFKEQGFETALWLSPMHLSEDNPGRQWVERAGFVPADGARIGSLGPAFQIGDREPRRFVLSVVALQTPGGTDAALVLNDLPYPVLTVSAESLNEREMRHWVDEWLGQMLVDYVQRL